ncbi:GTP cyclohydrolase II [Rheinheimera oceanensis]|uniref:GTP cyclohydrolase II n=2 Tax=Rheinheimera oceanensis TaxID=2817449 RepID=UPI00207B96FE|nr:GTP cyclohydrolase II [Rheinheimera oceanensis]
MMKLKLVTSTLLPTPFAEFRLHGFEAPNGKEHVALTLGDVTTDEPVLARVHSECLTGDALFSLRCDCGPQLEAAMRKIADAGRGCILYLRQEGRGIGLINKIRAYAEQDKGLDTVEANEILGFLPDMREYGIAAQMFEQLGIKQIRLLTNNPRKLKALTDAGVNVLERVQHRVKTSAHSHRYLATKASKLGHLP